uniref:RNA-directed DNA polymerase n=1 Tax=Amazona collaria TaxID=241587 RepID=A0A8B9F1Z8_9PSIT
MTFVSLSGTTKLLEIASSTKSCLENQGLVVAPEKVQQQPPWKYLGWKILQRTVVPQLLKIDAKVNTLNDVQKLTGTINWVRILLGIDNDTLRPLFELLKGEPALNSTRQLTLETEYAIEQVNRALTNQQAARIDYQLPVTLYVIQGPKSLKGLIGQWDLREKDPLRVLEWIFLPYQFSKTIVTICEQIAHIVCRGRQRTTELTGHEPDTISLPLTKVYFQWAFQNNTELQITMTNFGGKVTPHHPPHKLFSLTTEIEIKSVSKCQRNPVEGPTYFTDGSGKTGRAITVWFENNEWHHEEQKVQGSAQVVELAAVVFAFQHCHRALNLVTDSNYVAGVVTRIENSWLKEVTNPTLFYYLKMLKMLLDERTTPYYALHIHSHADLPGFIIDGNRRADRLTAPVVATPLPNQLEQARLSHAFYHQSARSVRKQFSLSWSEARTIVQTCPDCQPFATHPHTGVNPRGTSALQLWQSDVTHIPEFGRQKYAHVSIDTFSHMVWATAETGEKARDVIRHWRGAFAALGVPKQIKTDNGPAYNSKVIETFLNIGG